MINELLAVNLIKELGLESVPEERRNALVAEMTDVVSDRLNRRLIATLNDDEVTELNNVLDKGEDAVSFFQSKIPNFDILIAEEIAEFKREMLRLGAIVKDVKNVGA